MKKGEKKQFEQQSKKEDKHTITPDKRKGEDAPPKKKFKALFMGMDIETVFKEAEEKKAAKWIYIPSYARDEGEKSPETVSETND